MVVPSPNWPPALSPHAHSVPSDFRATVCSPKPAEIDTQLLSVPICTGEFLPVFVPSPSRPDTFFPHAQPAPPDLRPTVGSAPAATDVHLVSVPICTGEFLLTLVPSP